MEDYLSMSEDDYFSVAGAYFVCDGNEDDICLDDVF